MLSSGREKVVFLLRVRINHAKMEERYCKGEYNMKIVSSSVYIGAFVGDDSVLNPY